MVMNQSTSSVACHHASVLETDRKLKSGNELVTVNELLLVNVTKEYASNVLSNVQDRVRLLGCKTCEYTTTINTTKSISHKSVQLRIGKR